MHFITKIKNLKLVKKEAKKQQKRKQERDNLKLSFEINKKNL